MNNKELTVGELRKSLKGVSDDYPVRLTSDTGVDQGEGEVVIEGCYCMRGSIRTKTGYFAIYANDIGDEQDCEPPSHEEDERFKALIRQGEDIIERAFKEAEYE